MANKYTIANQKAVHFLTFTVHQAGRHLQCRPTDKKGFVIHSDK
jgi:hypothetical protein